MEQRGNSNSKKKEFQEDVLLPSQKSQEDEMRSPSSKFSNQHFHQLESNLPFGSGDGKPISPNKPASAISNIGSTDVSKQKLQKQMEYQAELQKQLEAKKRAEEERKRKEEEMDRKIEENIRINAEKERLQVEKERREKESKNNPPVAVGDVTSNRSAVIEPVPMPIVPDVKNDLFGNPSEARRSRRQRDTIVIEDSVPPPLNPVEVNSAIAEPPLPNMPNLNNFNNHMGGGMLPNIYQSPQMSQMQMMDNSNPMVAQMMNQMKQTDMMFQYQMANMQSMIDARLDKNLISYLLTQLMQQNNGMVPPQQAQFQQFQQTPQPHPQVPSLNISSNSQEDDKPEPVSARSRSLSNPVKPVTLEKEVSIEERPIRRKPKKVEQEERSDHDEAVIPKKEPEAAPIRRRRKLKPSLEEEFEEPKSSSRSNQEEGPPSASKKSKRVFKIGGQKNAEEDSNHNEEQEVAAQPKMPKPGPRSRRVFSVGKGNANNESSPIHSQPLSDEEYRNLDSD